MARTIAEQIESSEAAVAALEAQLDAINARLVDSVAPAELKTRKKAVEKDIHDKNKEIASLRAENRKTAMLSVIIVAFMFIIAYNMGYVDWPEPPMRRQEGLPPLV